MKNRTCNLGHNLESRYKYLKGLYTNFQLTISEGCVWFLPVLFKHTSTNEENVTVFFNNRVHHIAAEMRTQFHRETTMEDNHF